MNQPIHFECTSCPSQMATIRSQIRNSATAFGFKDEMVEHLVLAVDEACTNIIRHAYDGRNDGKIEVDILNHEDIWEVRLRDYGKRFDPFHLKGRPLNRVKPGGLGLFFIKQTFDDIHFDQTVKTGTCLILCKKKPTPEKVLSE